MTVPKLPLKIRASGARYERLSRLSSTSRWPSGRLYSARSRVGRDVVHLDQPGDGLLLQPLTHVPLDQPGPGGDSTTSPSRRRPGPIEPESIAQVDCHHLQHPDRREKQAPDECVALLGYGVNWRDIRAAIVDLRQVSLTGRPTYPECSVAHREALHVLRAGVRCWAICSTRRREA